MSSKIALVDGDIIAYRSAASCEPTKIKSERESLDEAIFRCDQLVYRVLNDTQSSEYRIFLSGTDNFRKNLDPNYKANRASQRRPEWLDPVREFLIREWKAEVCTGYEADDAIGISANENTIICSIDKDLRQIPGDHYNFVKQEFSTISDREAAYNFWSSLLIGDTSDNVRGIDGIGPVGARRTLADVDPERMESVVRGIYQDDERFVLVYRLLRILRSREELHQIENVISESQGTKLTEEGA